MKIDEDFAGKDCVVDSEEGCRYFEEIIMPGIKVNDKSRKKKF